MPALATITSPTVTMGVSMPEPRRSPTLRRRRLSTEIRALREAAKLTSVEATNRLGWSSGKLTRMERGEWLRPNPRDITDLCDLYGVTDERMREYLATLAKEGKERGWWHPYRDQLDESHTTYIGFEAGADEVYTFEPLVMPGLLQVPDYTRALLRGGSAELNAADIDQRVEIRTKRQQLLEREQDPLRLWTVIDEAAMRRQVGGPKVMRAQMQHLLQMTELAKVTLQVIPFEVGAHAGIRGAFSILKFPDPRDPDAVYVDTPAGQLFVEDPEEVKPFQVAFQRLQAAAIGPEDTIAMFAAEAAKS